MVAHEVRYLMKMKAREGIPITVIAKQYGVSRQTVYNVLNDVTTKGSKARESKLDPFKVYLEARLSQFDLLVPSLFQEIQAMGYDGGLTIVKDFVRPIKRQQVRLVIERFETEPGRQTQIDWGECGTITQNGERRKLYVFVMVLGFSRMLFARFTTSMRMPTFLACLREGFEVLGVSKELLVDNMKTAVDKHVTGEEVRFNRSFLDFCEHYGTLPVACPPYWPRAKGKVEAGVKYVKNSFLIGRSFTTLEDLNSQLDAWIDSVVNVRIHGTTKQKPVDRYELEINMLRAAASVPQYDTRELLIRKVHSDSHVRLAGSAYSVPPTVVGQVVHIRVHRLNGGESFEILNGNDVIASHVIAKSGSRATLEEHAGAIRSAARDSRKPIKPRKAFEQVLPAFGDPLGHHTAAPVVQVRSLSEYERFAETS